MDNLKISTGFVDNPIVTLTTHILFQQGCDNSIVTLENLCFYFYFHSNSVNKSKRTAKLTKKNKVKHHFNQII
jgi:hypothetical protein